MAMAKVESKDTKDTKANKEKPEVFPKVTHLYLHDKYLSSIGKLNGYIHLSVLYLHNNDIEKIENLESLKHLTSLYLQKNKIRKLENLDRLLFLQRLYIGHNEISVIENLEKLQSLNELHIEKQKLVKGSSICFDPRCVASLRDRLEVLNISGNNLVTIENLSPLYYLKILMASNNNITNIENITKGARHLVNLREASFSGNPIAKQHKYREKIIACTKLRMLDDRDISNFTRCFIRRMEEEKLLGAKPSRQLPEGFVKLSKGYPLAMQKAVSNLMLKPVRANNSVHVKLTTATDENYLPWKSLPNSFATAVRKVPSSLRKYKRQSVGNVPMKSGNVVMPSFL